MSPDDGIPLYRWMLREFTLEGRAGTVARLAPHLAALVPPGADVLDLCCGAGAFSFALEEQGARVTGIDFASCMMDSARETARDRRSSATFIHADVMSCDLGSEAFDLAVLLGNTVADFPPDGLIVLARGVKRSLKPRGRFAVHYRDGLRPFIEGEYEREAVQQDGPERITRSFKACMPDAAGYVETYTNEATGETCDYASYLYSPPFLRLAMSGLFELERAIRPEGGGYLDVFRKP